ncbi:hypothetical protein [Parasphingorhabdus sp.]|uniref:hypothetical protein n=1 Tax=Parasphingorhabdus sp. TaxID=2709688 RepID=UPI0007F326A0|nr:hypothetical protein A8B75_08990 [Sphingomonadales bacterium EhC05]
MPRRDSKFDDETTVEPSFSDGPLGEKFVRRETDLTEKINGALVEDTSKEFVIEKKKNAKN